MALSDLFRWAAVFFDKGGSEINALHTDFGATFASPTSKVVTNGDAVLNAVFAHVATELGGVGTIRIPGGYTFELHHDVIIDPTLTSSVGMSVDARNARFALYGDGRVGFKRLAATFPTSGTLDFRFAWTGGDFYSGDNAPNQVGMQFSCGYNCSFQEMHFSGLDTGLDLVMCLMTTVAMCRASVCASYGFRARTGQEIAAWYTTGASPANAQCNSTTFRKCRVYCKTGSHSAFYITGSSGAVVKECIVEGNAPKYGVYFAAGPGTFVSGAAVIDPPSTAAAGTYTTTIPVTGAVVGMVVTLASSAAPPAGWAVTASSVSAPGVVSVTWSNTSGGTLDPPSLTWTATCTDPLYTTVRDLTVEKIHCENNPMPTVAVIRVKPLGQVWIDKMWHQGPGCIVECSNNSSSGSKVVIGDVPGYLAGGIASGNFFRRGNSDWVVRGLLGTGTIDLSVVDAGTAGAAPPPTSASQWDGVIGSQIPFSWSQVGVSTSAELGGTYPTFRAAVYQIVANLYLAGHLYFRDDNQRDVGQLGVARRPRTVYAGTSLQAPAVNATATLQVGGPTMAQLKGIARGSANFDPPSTASGGTYAGTITVPGAVIGASVFVSPSGAAPAGWAVVQCAVTAADTVSVTWRNYSAGTVDPPNQTWSATVFLF
jgi:hypothetical protein